MLDLDGFKSVNDRFGHAVGDDLVTHIGGLLRQSVRKLDFIARLGGDEFAIILRDCRLKQATDVAEKVLSTIRNRGVVVTPQGTARVTTSCVGWLSSRATMPTPHASCSKRGS